MNLAGHPVSIGWLIALIVLVVVIVLFFTGHAITRDMQLALFGALALARMT